MFRRRKVVCSAVLAGATLLGLALAGTPAQAQVAVPRAGYYAPGYYAPGYYTPAPAPVYAYRPMVPGRVYYAPSFPNQYGRLRPDWDWPTGRGVPLAKPWLRPLPR
jgi:hypothetical protein